MAARKASEGIKLLRERTAGPKVVNTVVVDQVYAKYQHESLDFRHPRGGRAKYLEAPLYEGFYDSITEFSVGLLRVEEETAGRRWAGTGRALVRAVGTEAPLEFGDLRRSAGLTTREGSKIIVEEPASQPRLSDLELDAKKRMKSMGLTYR
jgi:hypothetical protein